MSTLLASPGLAAEAKLAQIFQDDMVLQREMPVPVWGWGDAGAKVTVSFAGQEKTATAGDDGRWQVTLDPMDANAKAQSLKADIGGTGIERKGVLVGEVWIAAGQSNMVHAGPDEDTGLYPHYKSPAGEHPPIRVVEYGFGASQEPLADLDDSLKDQRWESPTDKTMETSNIARYAARVIRDELDVPVGIVQVAVPGTNQAAWMAREELEKFPGEDGKANFYESFKEGPAGALAKNTKGDITTWDKFLEAEAKWRAEGKGVWPGRELGTKLLNFPAVLYNTRIHPLAPMAVRGAIWHQGEAGPGGPYGKRLAAMANQWRELFGQDFYFIYGTLGREASLAPPLEPQPTWFYRSKSNDEIYSAAESFGKDDKKVGVVEFYDVGDDGTHFLQKAEAGRRMGLGMLSIAYGKDTLFSGPLMKDIQLSGNKATITFDRVGDGIEYKPNIDGISGVMVSGDDGSYQWADVKVTGKDTIEVSSPKVSKVASVAYAHTQNPFETLFNSDGLPASSVGYNLKDLQWDPHFKGTRVVSLTGESKNGLNVAHIRQDGYVFQVKSGRNATDKTASVEAYVSKDWSGVEVTVDGKPMEVKTTEKDGRTFATFDVPADGKWIIVADKGKASTFSKINRI